MEILFFIKHNLAFYWLVSSKRMNQLLSSNLPWCQVSIWYHYPVWNHRSSVNECMTIYKNETSVNCFCQYHQTSWIWLRVVPPPPRLVAKKEKIPWGKNKFVLNAFFSLFYFYSMLYLLIFSYRKIIQSLLPPPPTEGSDVLLNLVNYFLSGWYRTILGSVLLAY